MLSQDRNERLTQVGPGTPCGELLRRYWIPVAPLAQLLEDPVRKVRVLGEDLVLYRDRSGGLGLIGERCLHRAVELRWGIPDECGLRCPYHGWLYGADGRCLDQPLEAPDSSFKERLRITAYRCRSWADWYSPTWGPRLRPCCRCGTCSCGPTPYGKSRSTC
jgi:5,5'-dehydrodivanillate O-demethylase